VLLLLELKCVVFGTYTSTQSCMVITMPRQQINKHDVSHIPCRWVALQTLDPVRTAPQWSTLPMEQQRRTGSASPAPLPSVHRLPSETGSGNTRWRDRQRSRRVRPSSWRTPCRLAAYASDVCLAKHDSIMHNVLSKMTDKHKINTKHLRILT